MTYFPDGTLLRRPSLLEWYKNRCDALGVVSTLSAARRHRSWRTFGWLEPAHEYSIGVCSEELRRLLDDAADHCVDRTRGFQRCLFCPGRISCPGHDLWDFTNFTGFLSKGWQGNHRGQ